MDSAVDALPDDVAALRAELVRARAERAAEQEASAFERAARAAAEEALRLKSASHATLAAEHAVAQAKAAEDMAVIAHQRLVIEKLQRQIHGPRSERSSRLIDQLEITFEELEATATEAELAAENAVAKVQNVAGFTRSRPQPRLDFPENLPRERVVVPGPNVCECCGGDRLRKLSEDVTKTLESIPRSWKVIETVREKFSCRDCEKISQAPAPFHVIPRGWAGPSLIAMILFEKFGQHQPLNRQIERYALEGVSISLSTVSDLVGASCSALEPLIRLTEKHTFEATRLHGDDTTVPVLAEGQTVTGRIWGYVRDDRPFGGTAPPSAMFYYSRDRGGEHPQGHLAKYTGIFQADAYSGYEAIYKPDRSPGPVLEAGCWAHARRPFFIMADIEQNTRRKVEGKKPVVLSPIAVEMVRRIDALFEIERGINGKSPHERLAVRQAVSKPIIDELEPWMREQKAKLSRGHDLVKAFNYMLNRWHAFTLFLTDGRVCLSNNAAERALRGIALGRRNWTFCGSDRGGQRAAAIYSLIVSAKMNNIDPHAWLADVLARIAGHPAHRLDELLPWNWKLLNQAA